MILAWERRSQNPRSRVSVRCSAANKLVDVADCLRGIEARGQTGTVGELNSERDGGGGGVDYGFWDGGAG